MNMHGQMMNLRCDVDANLPTRCGEAMAYKHGHHDARHAAAEAALKADACIEALLEALKRVLDRFDPYTVPGFETNVAAEEKARAVIAAVEGEKT